MEAKKAKSKSILIQKRRRMVETIRSQEGMYTGNFKDPHNELQMEMDEERVKENDIISEHIELMRTQCKAMEEIKETLHRMSATQERIAVSQERIADTQERLAAAPESILHCLS